MPLVRINSALHYYAHVPKCGGSSVETYLKTRFGSLALLNTRYLAKPEAERWTKSSPQHMTLDALGGLIPADWIASSFAVVRHPVKRLVSAYHFQLETEKSIAPLWSIDEWFAQWVNDGSKIPFQFDNHLAPQSAIVPTDAAIFRLEDGLAPLVAHLDGLAGNSDGARAIPKENVHGKATTARAVPSPATMDLIARYYAEDFRRYGYDPDPAKAAKAPRAATAAATATARPGGLLGRLSSGMRRKRG